MSRYSIFAVCVASLAVVACAAESSSEPDVSEPSETAAAPSDESEATEPGQPNASESPKEANQCYRDNKCRITMPCCSGTTFKACPMGNIFYSRCCRNRGTATTSGSLCCSNSASYWGSTLTCN